MRAMTLFSFYKHSEFMARFYTHLLAFRTALIFASICIGEVFFFPENLASQTCGCTNCPQSIQDFSTVDLLVQVANAANPVLGQNGQGICGVVLNFDHEYLGDLTIKLTSPAGQTVTLVGPEGFWGPTTFSEWNVTFFPCGDLADPDAGFTSKWNSDQSWGSFGTYSGSYYPMTLCLENLNVGPVNGTWKLTVKDAQENDIGNFYDYQIIFCDPTGVACQTCVADAGNFLQPDIVACEGSSALDLNLPPTFAPGQTAPPDPEYSYRYIIAGNGGAIQAYAATPDLTSRPAGSYTVCGMSYLTAQVAQIPAPNGILTTQQLATSLNSPTPPFCGNTTPNCVNVTIHPVPPNTTDTVVVCYPACYIFGGDTLCNSGIYTDTLAQNGCIYLATIHLLIEQPDTVQVYEAICKNQCSATPGFEQNCSSGVFQKTFKSVAGCDSTVILTLNVLSAGVQIAAPDTLYCNIPAIPLSGMGSSTGTDVTYSWTATNGGKIAGPVNGLLAVANASGTYQLKVCRTDTSGFVCCDSTTVSVIKSKAPPAVPGAIVGLGTLCLGQSATYSIPSVPGASIYTWVVPPNVTIQSGQGDTSIVLLWNSVTPSVICVTASDSCGNTSASKCRTILVGQVAPPASVPQGLAKVCADSPGTYQITPLAGATAYEWAINAPHTIISGQNTPSITIAWGNAPTAQICVKVTNSCGTSPTGCATVQIGFSPSALALSGDTTVCRNDTVAYVFPPIAGADSYTWAVTGGTLLNGQGTNNVQVVWDGGVVAGSICASAQNDCGNSPLRCLNVSISTMPVLGPVVRSCNPANLQYMVSFKVTGGTAPFSVAGGAVVNGIFTSNLIPNSTPYQFVITDANGCFSTTIKGNYDCNCISRAGQLNPQVLAACEGGKVTAQLSGDVTDPNDATLFVLHSDSTAALGTIFGQNTTGIFGIQNGMTFGVRYYLTHIVGNNLNGLPDPTDPCYEMSNAQPVIFYKNPVANAGADLVACGNTATLAASGTGQWAVTLQPSGGNLLVNNLKNPATGITASEFGRYVLTWTVVSADGCIGQDMVEVQFYPEPMLSDLTRICDIANQNYVVMFSLNGGTPPYAVNGNLLAGNSFTSGQFANNQPFSFTVADGNGCMLPLISGSYDCNCTSNAGTMQPQPLEVCADAIAQAQANQDLQPDADDVIGFALHDGSGPVLGTVFGRNTSGAFTFQPGMSYGKTYYISRMAGNSLNGLPNPLDPCFSVAIGQPVVFYEKPAPFAGRDTVICGQTYALQAVKTNYDGEWSFVTGPGPAIFSSPGDPHTAVQVLTSGTFLFQWTEQNHGCVVADVVQVAFNPMPEIANLIEVCNSTNSGYFIQFDMTTGTAPFSIAGVAGNFTGATFTSIDFLNNTGYLFTVTDANGCKSPDNFGSHNCVCSTDAGTMQVIPPTTYCAGETVSAIWNNNAMLDADDAVEFILHDQPGSLVGTIAARNSQPVFAWQPGFQSGVVYYISAIAGNAMAGTVNLGDQCLSVTPGVPVFWKALPSVTLEGTDTICAGDAALLSVMGSGAFPIKLTYSDGTSLFDVPLTGPQVVTLLVFPAVTTTYQLIAAEDGTNPVCATPLMDAFKVVVNQPLSAGTPNGPLALCEGEEWPVQLSNLLIDADFGGTWTETSASPAPPGNFNAATGTLETKGLPVGIYQFHYTVTSASPCSPDTSEVEVAINRLPDAEAGENKALNCTQLSVLLDGSSTSGNVRYTWFFGSDTVGMTPQIFAQDSGRYMLIVTNQFGCTATDSVQVDLANQPPQATFIVRGVRCFGDVNGFIAVDSILIGELPVLFSIDGAPFSDRRIFGSLVPGPHTVTLLDANGCEWTSDTLLVQQPLDFIVELGPDVEVHLGDSVTLEVDVSYPSIALKNIAWKPLLDTLWAGKITQHFLPLNTLRVTVEVTDTAGCKASDVVLVLVSRDRRIFIPNIIAPQSSENNVALIYGGDDVVEIESFQIFDRWGDLVFSRQRVQPNDKQHGWNGTTNGKDAQPGVYVYQAQIRFVDGRTEAFFGSLTVVR